MGGGGGDGGRWVWEDVAVSVGGGGCGRRWGWEEVAVGGGVYGEEVGRAVTIYQYVAILQYDVSQYNSIHLLRHIDILRRAIYCSVLRVLYYKCAQ